MAIVIRSALSRPLGSIVQTSVVVKTRRRISDLRCGAMLTDSRKLVHWVS
jgi:hypothetical protein